MYVGDWLDPTASLWRRRKRDVFCTEERVHVAVRQVDPEERGAYVERLRETAESLEGVRWARYNAYLGRLVVQRGREIDLEELLAAIERVEDEFRASVEYISASPANAGDAEAERIPWVELGLDVVTFVLSTGLRLGTKRRFPFDVDVAAAVAVLEGLPRVQKGMERGLSRRTAELTLELARSWSQILVRSELGPVSGSVRHLLRLREARTRRRVWAEREGELCGSPDEHPARCPARKARPVPLKEGPIERYDRAAVPAAIGAFGLGALYSPKPAGATSPLFAGLPRASREGRSGFAAHLGWVLAERGVLVVDGEALRRLDRMDTVVLPQELAERSPEATDALIRCARRLALDLRVVGPDVRRVAGLQPHEQLHTDRKLSKIVRRLQRTGAGVILIAESDCEGYRAADVGFALSSQPPPWGAHVIARHGVHDAVLFLEAVADAKLASEQSVAFAMAEAATALVLSLAGLNRETSVRAMSLANGASLIAMANGARLAHGLRRPVPAPRVDETPYHAMEPDAVLEHLDSRPEGLRASEAARRRPPIPPAPSRLSRLALAVGRELANPITPILGLGAGLSASVGSVLDAGLILGALGIDVLVGGTQRLRAERAIAALQKKEDRAVRCFRDGVCERIQTDELVTGDVVEVETGEVVPADLRLLEVDGLEVDESALTGESLPVRKSVEAVDAGTVAERTSMLYAGASVAAGGARGVVVAVGEDTEAGRAYSSARERTVPGGVEARLSSLSKLTMPMAGASALVVLGSGLARGRSYRDVINVAVGLGVASVPEGLPILSTLAQLTAARRLGARGVLVRNPRALEPLGRVDVLCCDKTGTLTEGKIRLDVVSDGKRVVSADDAEHHLRDILAVATRATPRRNGEERLPHPTDEALLAGGDLVGIEEGEGLGGEHDRIDELPFEPARGLHATLGSGGGSTWIGVKGAPEVVLPRCTSRRTRKKDRPLSRTDAKTLVRMARSLGRRGYRVLAVADREADADETLNDDAVRGLTFRGFVGFADPVRGTARAAIEDLRAAGVRILMLTGDHPSTAEAIAGELGLDQGEVLTGAEVDALDEEELADRLMNDVNVVARVTPLQKVRMVRALRARRRTVGMTGDGANDAAAIGLADVGIAVGAESTAAARHAADLVVTDERIETIVEAVLEGRALWKSVRDAVSILVGGNLGEIAFTTVTGLLSGGSLLNARQLLLVNLITDTLPALAIATRPPEREHAEALLGEGPDVSLGSRLDRDLFVRAAVTAGAAATAYVSARLTGSSRAKASTVGLVSLTGAQLGQTLLVGGSHPGVLAAGLGSLAVLLGTVETPGLSHFFGCRPLGPIALGQAAFTTAAATAIAAAIARREATTEPEPEPEAKDRDRRAPEPRARDREPRRERERFWQSTTARVRQWAGSGTVRRGLLRQRP